MGDIGMFVVDSINESTCDNAGTMTTIIGHKYECSRLEKE